MCKLLERFRTDTDGSVSADWVVLAAGVVALGAGAASVIFDGTSDLGEMVADQLAADDAGEGVDSADQLK